MNIGTLTDAEDLIVRFPFMLAARMQIPISPNPVSAPKIAYFRFLPALP
jgi:hypothetical protein